VEPLFIALSVGFISDQAIFLEIEYLSLPVRFLFLKITSKPKLITYLFQEMVTFLLEIVIFFSR
jgi:hypothetical protein